MKMADQEQKSSLQNLGSMMRAGLSLQRRAFEMAQANMKLTFDYMNALTGCRTPNDFASVTQEFTRKQVDAFKEQTKDLDPNLPGNPNTPPKDGGEKGPVQSVSTPATPSKKGGKKSGKKSAKKSAKKNQQRRRVRPR
jgi:hypothetical protein